MTREELIDILGEELFFYEYGDEARKLSYPKNYYNKMAVAAIDAIYEALKEPTQQMKIVVSKNWGRRTWEEYKEVINASPLNKGE